MSENVFADLGLPQPEEHLLKAQIVSRLDRVIRGRKLTQTKVAAMTGLTQPQLSRILGGNFRDISVEKLLRVFSALDYNVRIVIDEEPAAAGSATVSVLV